MIPDYSTPGSKGTPWKRQREISLGKSIREEVQFKTDFFRENVNNTHLTEEEKRDIEILLRALHDDSHWHKGILSFGDDSIGDKVVLSEERKSYLELFVERHLLPENEEDRDDDLVKEIQAVRVLGEYKKGTIILYINNIKDSANETNAPGFYDLPYLTVTRYVYLHELMHAYFVRKENKGYKYDREREEAFAEFGALLLLDRLVRTNHRINHASKEELEWAIRHVEGKRGALECYSRGANLFKRLGQDEELASKMLAAYPKLSFPDLV
jgi:hypothetical protein